MEKMGNVVGSVFFPFVEPVCRDEAAPALECGFEGRLFRYGFAAGVDQWRRSLRRFRPAGHEPPAHGAGFEAVVGLALRQNHAALGGCDIEARGIFVAIAVVRDREALAFSEIDF